MQPSDFKKLTEDIQNATILVMSALQKNGITSYELDLHNATRKIVVTLDASAVVQDVSASGQYQVTAFYNTAEGERVLLEASTKSKLEQMKQRMIKRRSGGGDDVEVEI